MSCSTVPYSVRVDQETLLNLFLGRGEINIVLDGYKTTIQEIRDRHVRDEDEGVEYHKIAIRGVSDNPKIVYVDGMGTLTVQGDTNSSFNLELEIHLQDDYS